MFEPNLTALLGVYRDQKFLDRAACDKLKEEMRKGGQSPATVYDRRGWQRIVDQRKRSALRVAVSRLTITRVRQRLLEALPEIGRHFASELNDCDEPTFLIYRPDDFFELHRDNSTAPAAPEFARRRAISVVIFLNHETTADCGGEYDGGSLALYGLVKDPRCEQMGLPVHGQAGLLIAFRSELWHEVKPVSRGERFTIVSWLYSDRRAS